MRECLELWPCKIRKASSCGRAGMKCKRERKSDADLSPKNSLLEIREQTFLLEPLRFSQLVFWCPWPPLVANIDGDSWHLMFPVHFFTPSVNVGCTSSYPVQIPRPRQVNTLDA